MRRWLRASAIGLFVILLGSIGFYWLWGNRVWSRLAVERAAIKAAGEAVTSADLMQPPVPDERNAALLLRQAASLIDESSDDWREMTQTGSRLPLADEEQALFARVVEANQKVFPLVTQATKLNEFDWQIDFTVGLINLDLKDLTAQRRLATLLQAAAVLEHQRGNDARAIELAEQIRFISEAVGTQPTLVSSLVSTGLSAMQVRLLGEMVPTLKISQSDPGAATPQQMRALINQLLDDASRRTIFRRGLAGERAFQQDLVQDMLGGQFNPIVGPAGGAPPNAAPRGSRFLALLLNPVMKDNGLVMVRHMNRLISGLDAPDLKSFRLKAPAEMDQAIRSSYRHLFAQILLPSLTRSVDRFYRSLDDRHLVATALAARWYEVDHDGQLPESLEQLVPDYLPRVPIDTLAGRQTPIAYLNDPQRPRVYHVGENGKDDGGREPDPDASPRLQAATSDEVVHLRPQPRPTNREAR